MRAVALLAPILLAAGCSGVSVEGLQRADAPREPHYEEHRDLVAPQHDRSYPFPVEAGATLVNATLRLEARTSGLPLPGVTNAPSAAATPEPAPTPARLVVELLDPEGGVAKAAQVDPSAPYAALLLEAPSPAGEWTLRVSGTGAAGRVEGEDYGAAYLLTVEVLYA